MTESKANSSATGIPSAQTPLRSSSPMEGPAANPAVKKSFRDRIAVGGAWAFGGFMFAQSLRLISNLILTRLLMPEAFGLMAVANAFTFWAAMMTDIGINLSVVRSEKSEDLSFVHTAWTMQVARNTLVAIFIVLLSVGVYFVTDGGQSAKPGSIFSQTLLPYVVASTGIVMLISGFGSMNRTLAQRKLDIGRLVPLEIGAQLFALAVTIAAAFAGLGIWALVLGMIAGAAANVFASHVFIPGPPMAFAFHRGHFDDIFGYGKWLLVASFFGFLVNKGDSLIYGWLFEQRAFSLYTIAMIWIAAAGLVLDTLFSRIAFTGFSEVLRERPQDLGRVYRGMRNVTDAGVVVMALGAMFVASEILDFLYSDEYAGIGDYVRLLAPMLLLYPYKLLNQVVMASGGSKAFTIITIIPGICMLVFVPGAYFLFGMKASILVFASIRATVIPVQIHLAAKRMPIDWKVEIRMAFVLAAAVLYLIIS